MEKLVARQPVFDRSENFYGYALAVRHTAPASGTQPRIDELSPEILAFDFIERVSRGQRAFVTVDRPMVVGGAVRQLPADRVVLQMSGRLEDDPELLHACDQLVWSGYRFAFECDRPGGLPEGFVRLAEIVRIDVSGTDESRLSNVAAWLREYHVRLLAAQVRHRGERDVCAHLGFELFEGHRFNAPETPARYDMPIDHARTFRLLRMVRDDRTPDSEIEELLRRDGALSYKLLSMVHFTATGRRDVRSIGHALHLVGRHQVGRWLALLLVSHGAADGLRAELVTLSLVRARMCELLADAAGIPQARGDLFLVGLLSTLGLLLEMPMEAVCDSMELDVETRVALESRGGVYGAALGLVEAYERADWDEVEARASALGLRAESLGPAYLDALAGAGAPAERLASLGGLARGTA